MFLKLLKNTHAYLILLFLCINISFFVLDFFLERFEFPICEFYMSNVLWATACVVLLGLQCVGLNNIVHEKDIIKKPNFVTAFVFLILCTPFNLNPINIFSSIVLLFFLNFILKLHKEKSPFKAVYNASIVLSFCSFFVPEALFLSSLIIISSVIFRNLSLRICLIVVMGVSTPYLFIYTAKYLFELNFTVLQFNLKYININDYYNSFITYENTAYWYTTIFIVSLFATIEIFRWIYKKSAKSRESFMIIICYLIISSLISVFFHNSNTLFLCLAPLSIIISNFFVYHKNSYLSEILFAAFAFISIFYRVSMINL